MKRCWLHCGGPIVVIIFLQLSLLFKLASSFLAPTVWLRRTRRSHLPPRSSSPFLAAACCLAAAASQKGNVENLDNADSVGCSIGVIGCGTIASAIVTGLATLPVSSSSAPSIRRITVTPRSAAKSAALQKRFPQLVTVVDNNGSNSNQAVLEASDIIFLTVLPQQAQEVLRDLNFDAARHTLVSLVSTTSLPDLVACSQLPADRVYKMICLPAVAYHEGLCLLQPATTAGGTSNDGDDAVAPAAHADTTTSSSSLLYQLLNSLGGVAVAANDRQMSAMMVPSGMMGGFYGVLRNHRDWLASTAGMSREQATFVVTRSYHGMMQDAVRRLMECRSDGDKDDIDDAGSGSGSSTAAVLLDELIAEQTPGGLNEQALANLETLGVMDSYSTVQAALFRRIVGETDGSLP